MLYEYIMKFVTLGFFFYSCFLAFVIFMELIIRFTDNKNKNKSEKYMNELKELLDKYRNDRTVYNREKLHDKIMDVPSYLHRSLERKYDYIKDIVKKINS